MKTFIQENGFEYSHGSQRFGNPKQFINEFQYLMSFEVDLMLIDQTENLSYRITDDNYIQFCCSDENGRHHRIVAQQELTGENLKEQVYTLLRDYIVGLLLFVGYPYKLNNSLLFTPAEFKKLVSDAEAEYDRLKNQAKKRNRQNT